MSRRRVVWVVGGRHGRMSELAKNKEPARAGKPGLGRPSYSSSAPRDPGATTDMVLGLPPESLHTTGLAVWYLGQTARRRSDQCLGACLVLELAMRVLGLDARTVACTVDIPWAVDGNVRYGSRNPRFDRDGLVGHTVLLVDGFLLDPTASQFPELHAETGSGPLTGRLDADLDAVARSGAEVRVRLGTGKDVVYRVLPESAATRIVRRMLDAEDDAIVASVYNLLSTYSAALAALPESAVAEVRRACPLLAAKIDATRGTDVTTVSPDQVRARRAHDLPAGGPQPG